MLCQLAVVVTRTVAAISETWEEPLRNATSYSDNLFSEAGDHFADPSGPSRIKFGTPHWVDFGQELEHSPDGKAYLVAHGAASPSSTEMWMLGDQVYLARVTPTVANIGDKSKWEFYAGGHGSAAKWVAGDVSKATPLVEFTNHTGCTTMTCKCRVAAPFSPSCDASKKAMRRLRPDQEVRHVDQYRLQLPGHGRRRL